MIGSFYFVNNCKFVLLLKLKDKKPVIIAKINRDFFIILKLLSLKPFYQLHLSCVDTCSLFHTILNRKTYCLK